MPERSNEGAARTAPGPLALPLAAAALVGAGLLLSGAVAPTLALAAAGLVALAGAGLRFAFGGRGVEPPSPPDPLADAMDQILEQNHDASSALSTALLDAEFLVKLSNGSSDAQVREVASELIGSLQRLKAHVDETRRLGQSCRGAAAAPPL